MRRSIQACFESAFTWFITFCFEWKERKQVKKQFYANRFFARVDQKLLSRYRWQSPYALSRIECRKRGEPDCDLYGETPLTTMAKIAKMAELSVKDRVIDLGAGRGRAALFLASYFGCSVRGYEHFASFVERFEGGNAPIKMYQSPMEEADFSWATVIYLYGTLLSDQKIRELVEKFPKEAKIITVSYPLNMYDATYKILAVIEGIFPWGKTEIYLNSKIS